MRRTRIDVAVDVAFAGFTVLGWLCSLIWLVDGREISPINHFFTATAALVAVAGWLCAERTTRRVRRAQPTNVIRVAAGQVVAINPDGTTCSLPCMCPRHGGRS